MTAPSFPPTIYVTLNPDENRAETLEAAFTADVLEGEIVGVYQFTGTLERRFVPLVESEDTLEQRRNAAGNPA